jgi:hypothetical protein
MKRIMVAAGLAGVIGLMAPSMTAFAGKREREFMEKELAPKVKDASDKFKSSCGCSLAITVDDSTTKSTDDMRQARSMAGTISEGAPKFCTDAASKKAVCQLKSLVLAKAVKPAVAEFTFKDGKGMLTQDGQMYTGWDQMIQKLDK